MSSVHFAERPPCVLGDIQQRKRIRQHRLWNASTVWVYILAVWKNFFSLTHFFCLSLSVLQLHSIYILFKQADMPCLDCRWKELKSLLTFAVAPLSHARVCKETFSYGVRVCVLVSVCVCASTVAPILISSRNYVLEMAMKSSLVSLFLIPCFLFPFNLQFIFGQFPYWLFLFFDLHWMRIKCIFMQYSCVSRDCTVWRWTVIVDRQELNKMQILY